jgi:hypothetical protein
MRRRSVGKIPCLPQVGMIQQECLPKSYKVDKNRPRADVLIF